MCRSIENEGGKSSLSRWHLKQRFEWTKEASLGDMRQRCSERKKENSRCKVPAAGMALCVQREPRRPVCRAGERGESGRKEARLERTSWKPLWANTTLIFTLSKLRVFPALLVIESPFFNEKMVMAVFFFFFKHSSSWQNKVLETLCQFLEICWSRSVKSRSLGCLL